MTGLIDNIWQWTDYYFTFYYKMLNGVDHQMGHTYDSCLNQPFSRIFHKVAGYKEWYAIH